jgi:Flp pilus assembly pilin Flp
MFGAIRRFIGGDSGAIAAEYWLIAALISVSCIIALSNLRASIAAMDATGATSIADSTQ